jgi:tetratricopeptide (TPR) repeat protein
MKRNHIIMLVIALIGVLLYVSCQQTAITSAKLYLRDDRRDYDSAIEQCKLAIEQIPQNPEAYYLLGKAYGKKQMYPDMNEAYNTSLKQSAKYKTEIEQDKLRYWTNLFNGGLQSNRQNQLEDAVSKYKMAIELLPNRTEPYKNLAFTYSQLKETDLSIETYEKAMQVDPDDLEIKYNLGMTYYNTQKYNEAIPYFQEVVDKGTQTMKEYNDSMIHLAFCYDLLQKPEKAEEIYKKALEEFPDNKDILFNLARLLINREEYNAAIEIMQKVLDQDPNDFYANMGMANSYLKLENFTEAIKYYEKAVEIQPENSNAWYNLAISYYRTGMTEKSQKAFDKSEELKAAQE